MSLIIPYLLKLSISIAVIYLFYQLVLRRLTFYSWNRWYLLLYSGLAFFLPFVNLSPMLQQQQWTDNGLVKFIPAVGDYDVLKGPTCMIAEQTDWTTLVIITALGTGMLVLLIRLGIQYLSLIRLRRSAQLILNDTVKVYQVNQSIIPFSFGKSIYLNQHLHNEEELKEIVRHEFVHVKQRHSLDIICIELFCLLNWYNPFAWLMRKAIRQNLEFIADQQVLQTGFDRKQYQYLLLKVTGNAAFSIASNFNFSSLKKRIAMMNRTKSARVHLMRFLFVLPLLAVILVAFRNTVQSAHNNTEVPVSTDTIPSDKKLWEKVERVQGVNGKLTLFLKDGGMERFDLSKADEKAAFEKKYGKVPDFPPAPLPPSPGSKGEQEFPVPPPTAKGEPEFPVPPPALENEPSFPVPPPAPENEYYNCINKKGYCITVADNDGECVVIVKDNKLKIILAVALTDWDSDPKYEQKYGEIPPAPAKPATVPVPSKKSPGKTKAVSGVHVKDNDAIVTYADGGAERFDISDPEEAKAYKTTVAGGRARTAGSGVATATRARGVSAPVAATGTTATIGTGSTVAVGGVAEVVDGAEEVVAVIYSTTTRDQLEKIKNDLEAKGLNLQLQNTEFKSGKLVSINGKLTSNDGGNWSFSSDGFKRITLSISIDENGKKDLHIRISDEKVRV